MMINQIKFISQAKEHMSNIFWSNLNQGLFTLSGLVISMIFVRFAGKELFGQYLFVHAIFGLFSIISIPGAATVIFRTTAQGYDGVYQKATTFRFLWSLLGIPLVVITGFFFYLFRAKTLGICLIACAFFFPFETSLQNWMVFLKGRSDFKKLTINNSIKLLVKLTSIIAVILFSKNVIVILVAYYLVEGGFNVFYYLRTLHLSRSNELDPAWKRQSYALTIMDLSGVIFGRVDILLIGTVLQFGQVAIYGLAMKFVDIFLMVIRNTTDVILPKLYKSEKITIRHFYVFCLLSFLIPIVLYPIVKYPVLLLYGRECSDVVVYSQVYLAIIPFYFLNSIATGFLVKYRLNREINFGRIISIVSVVVLYLTLIPLYGIWGAIISSMLYHAIEVLINLLILKISRSQYVDSVHLNGRRAIVESSYCKSTL